MPEFVADPLHSTGTAAGTGDIADVAVTEAEGTATSIPRGDHVHAHGSGYAGGHTDSGVSQAYTTVQDDGTPETQRSILNFQDGFIVVDDGVDSTDVDLDYGSPTASIDIGDAQADGVATTVARSDHQHAFPAPGAGYPLDVAAAESDGVATTSARSDHVHAHGSGYLPDAHHSQSHGVADHSGAITVEEANVAAGDASVLDFGAGFDVSVAVDEADITLDASEVSGAPVQIDIGDTQTTGASSSFANADHQHAFPAPGAGYPLDVAAAESDGVATTPARSDHVHAHGSGYAGGHTDSASSTIASGAYGDGSDGNVNITGTVTLTEDKFYDTLTISSGDILQPAGYRVFCRTELNLESGGLLRRNGATGTTADMTEANLLGGRGGGAGSTGAGGAGTSSDVSLQNLTDQGGDGGAGSSGAGGDGGDSETWLAKANDPFHWLGINVLGILFDVDLYGSNVSSRGLEGGAGGGGGGGNGIANSGGNGGQGGGVLVIAAFTLTLEGIIEAKGGNGTNDDQGGGGGGGGGNILLTYRTKTGAGSIDVSGGTGGTGGTNNGVNGQAGVVRELVH